MRAALYRKFGSARDVLELCDVDTPSPGPGEVLVRLHASAINPSDVKKRAGAFPDLLNDGFVIPNSDGAGVIDSVGEVSTRAAKASGSGSSRHSTNAVSERRRSMSPWTAAARLACRKRRLSTSGHASAFRL